MSLALKARQKVKRKGGGSKERVFGCDLVEHLQQSGKDVPQVLQSCAEFVEQHGVVDGIYRLSGVSSNIQRLRQEFDAERSPELRRAVYLQDIHCVSSLCKAYFRELPNPLLTFRLYERFADAVATQMEEVRLVKIKEVLKELPPPHYRTLEFLMRHLLRMASHSHTTNMHARNLAIVWAPNLLRSRDIETSGFNGTAAFMEVRVQSIVVEFILTHVEQLFGDAPLCGGDAVRRSRLFPGDGSGPYNVPAALSQGDGPPPIRPYHTIIELSEHRRKGSLKAKKWKSIFHLGRSDAKRKLGKAEEKEEKCGKLSLRPAKSMDSLSSVPYCAEAEPRLSTACAMKQAAQRRESFDACSSLPPTGTFPALEESPEEKPTAAEEPRGPESESESSSKSEPTTPRPGRVAAVGARSRAEKCAGVHISGPFSVTVPLHITSNLSRLTRGQQCPALAQHGAAGSPVPGKEHKAARNNAEEDARLSMELRDSFAFLDCQDTWLEHGDGDTAARAAMGRGGFGDGEGYPAMEEGMESGFMNPGESPVGQPPSYLSIEECMDEEMFYLAPSGPDEPTGDTDSDDMFLSAHDELSPLAADPETPTSGERGAELWGGSSPPVEEDPGDGGSSEEDPGGGTEEVGGQSLVNEERGGGGGGGGIGWSRTESGGEVEEDGAEERCGVGDPKTSPERSPQEPTEVTIPRGALGGVPKVPPTPVAAQGDPPTPMAVPEVLPTPRAEQGVLPTPMEVQEVPPTPVAIQGVSPTPMAAQEDPPTPTAAQGVPPTPMASQGVPPTPMEVQEDPPTPMAVQGVSPTPIAAPKVTPTPMASQEDPPIPVPIQDIPLTPITAPKVTPTPMAIPEVSPTPMAAQEDPPTPMPIQGVPPTPMASQEDPPTPVPIQGVPPTPMPIQDVPPTPMAIPEVSPTPMAAQEDPPTPVPIQGVPPTPMPIQDVPPTPMPIRGVTPTPMPIQGVPPTPVPIQDVPPTPMATQEDPPTPMPIQGVPPTPTAAAMGFSPPPEAVTPTPTPGPSREPSPSPGPCHPHPRAVLRRDGSAPVLLASRSVRVQQARSVPVVPPKPQFATVPPPQLRPQPPRAEGQRANWHHQRPPMRRIHTYGGEELPSPSPPRRPPPQPLPPRPPTSALPQSPNEAAAAAAP